MTHADIARRAVIQLRSDFKEEKMSISMNHTGFVVRDLDKAVAFYRDVVGLNHKGSFESEGGPISQLLGYDNVRLKGAQIDTGEGHVLELLQYVHPVGADRDSEERSTLGASHLAFIVDDIDQTYQKLIDNGAKKLNPPVQLNERIRSCYLQDPDGNWLEFAELNE